jgi:hypothetical protein
VIFQLRDKIHIEAIRKLFVGIAESTGGNETMRLKHLFVGGMYYAAIGMQQNHYLVVAVR